MIDSVAFSHAWIMKAYEEGDVEKKEMKDDGVEEGVGEKRKRRWWKRD